MIHHWTSDLDFKTSKLNSLMNKKCLTLVPCEYIFVSRYPRICRLAFVKFTLISLFLPVYYTNFTKIYTFSRCFSFCSWRVCRQQFVTWEKYFHNNAEKIKEMNWQFLNFLSFGLLLKTRFSFIWKVRKYLKYTPVFMKKLDNIF